MQILKGTGIDWRESRLISKLYMDQRVKIRLDKGEKRSVKIGRGVRQGCCVSLILFSLYSEYLDKEIVEGSAIFKRGQVIRRMEYAGDLVLLSEDEAVLPDMTERLTDKGMLYEIEVNLEKERR